MTTRWKKFRRQMAEVLGWALATGFAWALVGAVLLDSATPLWHALLWTPVTTFFLFGFIAHLVLPGTTARQGGKGGKKRRDDDEPVLPGQWRHNEWTGQYTAHGMGLNLKPGMLERLDDQ